MIEFLFSQGRPKLVLSKNNGKGQITFGILRLRKIDRIENGEKKNTCNVVKTYASRESRIKNFETLAKE